MKNQRLLFLVNSTYQIIVAIGMISGEYKGCKADLIISDRLNCAEKLAESVSQAGCFENVWAEPLEEMFPSSDRVKMIALRFFQKAGWKAPLHMNEWYDILLFANINFDSGIIYRQLKKRNPALKVFMFEDGYGTYTQDFATRLALHDTKLEKQLESRMDGYHKEGLLKKWYYRWAREVLAHVDALYVFTPEAMSYKPSYPVIKMTKMDSTNENLVTCLNRVFGYADSEDRYDKRVIFFEESYFADGYEVDDIACVEKLAAVCGKENIMVKIHPRNKENRFYSMGYKTNQNTFIPWEVIALNLDLTKKVLITIASGSAMTSLMNMGVKPEKVIMLMRCKDLIKPDNLAPAADIMERVAVNFPNVVAMPKTIEEFETLCRELKINKRENSDEDCSNYAN